jgi:hypothetical protein
MRRHIAVGLVWLGRMLVGLALAGTVVLLMWLVVQTSAVRAPPRTLALMFVLNILPLPIIAGIPALIGWWVARVGAKWRRTLEDPPAEVFD